MDINCQPQTVKPFADGTILYLQKRKKGPSGITYDLHAMFETMVKQGLLENPDGKFTKKEAYSLYKALDNIHKERGLRRDYTQMRAGTEFEYSGEELKTLAQAAGYVLIA